MRNYKWIALDLVWAWNACTCDINIISVSLIACLPYFARIFTLRFPCSYFLVDVAANSRRLYHVTAPHSSMFKCLAELRILLSVLKIRHHRAVQKGYSCTRLYWHVTDTRGFIDEKRTVHIAFILMYVNGAYTVRHGGVPARLLVGFRH